jgi:hypothetical protein
MKRSLVLLAFLVAGVASGPARSDPCTGPSPFPDVPASAIFCSDALWAKNANVTLGCTVNAFCPGDPVTRGQMVLFMRRLAEAIFPVVLLLTESTAAPSGDLDGAGVAVCTTNPFNMPAADANDRFVHANAVVSLRAGASADVQVVVSRSVDGGAFVPAHTVPQLLTVPAGQWATASVMIGYGAPLVPGSSYRWRIDLSRAPGSATTGELTDQRCQLKVRHQMDPT